MHLHEHCGDLGNEFSTAPMEVLWVAGSAHPCRSRKRLRGGARPVDETLHAQIGMRRERVTTFGHIEEWSSQTSKDTGSSACRNCSRPGAKTICLANHFANNMNVWGVGTFCVTVDHKVPESVGEDKLRAFCDDARAAGATVQMWGNTGISTLDLLFDNRIGDSDRIRFLPREGSIMEALDKNTSFVRTPSNAIDADHYTPEFAVLNLRDPLVREYLLTRWKAAHDDLGLGAIFLYSSGNLSVINSTTSKTQGRMNTARRPIRRTCWDFFARRTSLRRRFFAVSRSSRIHCRNAADGLRLRQRGSRCFRNPSAWTRRRRSTGLPLLWNDCIVPFDARAIRAAGHDPDDAFFRGLAYRMMWALHWDISKDALKLCQLGPVLRGRRAASSAPRLAPGLQRGGTRYAGAHDPSRRAGVLYRSPSRHVLWAFKDLNVPVTNADSMRDVLSGEFTSGRRFFAKRHGVYAIKRSQSAATSPRTFRSLNLKGL